MNVLSIENAMAAAFQKGHYPYRPTLAGTDLLDEIGDPAVSLENLRRLNREVTSVIYGPFGILLVFTTGETFWPTGLTLGRELGRYLQSVDQGRFQDDLEEFCETWPKDVYGTLPIYA